MKTNSVIVYLVRNTKRDIKDLKKSLHLLDINFNDRFNYPVVIFHENFTDTIINNIRSHTNSYMMFEKITFEIPNFLNKLDIPKYVYIDDSPYSAGFNIGYRHMCRFFAGMMYNQPILKDFDYYWRLDTHSYILKPIKYNVFEYMMNNNFEYGYVDSGKDIASTDTLWQTTLQYFKDKNIYCNKMWNGFAYGTNFEISSFEFWRSKVYQDFFNYIDKSGGIYKYRWGDHIIHHLALTLFMPEHKLHKFADIIYQHKEDCYNHKRKVSLLSKLVSPFYIHLLRVSSLLKKKSKLYRKFRDGN